MCFLPGQACNLWHPQVFPLPAAVPADLGCHSGESWPGLAQRTGGLTQIWVAAVGQPRERILQSDLHSVFGEVTDGDCDLSLCCPFSLTLIHLLSNLFSLEKSIPCSSCHRNIWKGCAGAAQLPAHPSVLGEDSSILGNKSVLALLMLFILGCFCPVPLLPGAAAPHPQYHRHRVALLFLLPTAQVSLSGWNLLPPSHRVHSLSLTVSMLKES